MTTLPYLLSGTCTKSDSSAYTSTVWITNETTNETSSVDCNSSGQYIYDIANFQSGYSDGDKIILSLRGFENPGYLLTSKPFEDTSIDTIEFEEQRLNTATLTVNFKVGYGISKNKARVEVFRKFYTLINGDLPTYLDKDSATVTYSLFSSFPEVTPVFPCIVIPPIEKDTIKLGVANRLSSTSLPCSLDIEFYAKTKDGKNAIDSARDFIQMLIENNWTTETITVSGEGGQEKDLVGIE